MSAIAETRRYELRLYAPKSVDATETQVLAQLEDAGETFVVTTDPSDARPYLERPTLVGGQIQEPERRVEVGSSTVRILDARVAGNLDRWVTRFLGAGAGTNQLLGLKAQLREWDGAAWSTVYTRRVSGARMQGTKLWLELELRDMVDDLDVAVFTGRPHASIDYAARGSLLPAGLVDSWSDLPTVAPLRGTVKGSQVRIDRGLVDEGRDVVIQALRDATADTAVLDDGFLVLFRPEYCPGARVVMTIVASPAAPGRVGETGEFWVARTIGVPGAFTTPGLDSIRSAYTVEVDEKKRQRVTALGFTSVPAADPAYLAPPADDDVVDVHVVGTGPATEIDPLLIGPVHPARLTEDLVAGRFGSLIVDPVDGTVGDPIASFGADTAAFTALKGDASFGDLYIVATSTEELRELVEKRVNLAHGLAYRIDELAQYVPLDYRLTSAAVAGLQEITDTDVVADDTAALEWDDQEDGAITRVVIKHRTNVMHAALGYFLDEIEGVPEWPAVRFFETEHERVEVLRRFGQLSDNSIEVDAIGIRDVAPGVRPEASARVQGQLNRIVGQFRSPFGSGRRHITLKCRRTAVVESCREGDLRKITYSAVPDPATNRRGGPRLGRCVQRTPMGQHIRLRFLDLGSDVVANPPAVGVVAINATDGEHAIDVPITLNAADEPAVAEYIVTDTTVGVRPDADDPGWVRAGRLTADGTAVVRPAPAGKRIWPRAWTEPDETSTPKIASGYVYPAAEYIDTTAIPAPTALTLTAVGRTIVATWTAARADLGVMPILGPDPGPAIDFRREALPGGTTRFVFDDLPAGTFVAGVKHVDGHGGESTDLTASVATGAADQLVAPRRLQIRQGGTSLIREQSVPGEKAIGYGLWVSFHPAEPLARHRVQISKESDFSTLENERLLDPGVARTPMMVERDAVRDLRYVRIRAERRGFVDSAYSDVVSALPVELLATPGPDLFPGGYAELVRRRDLGVELHMGDGGDGDTDRIYYAYELDPADESVWPAVDENSDYVEAGDFPYIEVLTDGAGDPVQLGTSEVGLLRARCWNRVAGFGQEILDKLPAVFAEVAIGVELQPLEWDDTTARWKIVWGPAVTHIEFWNRLYVVDTLPASGAARARFTEPADDAVDFDQVIFPGDNNDILEVSIPTGKRLRFLTLRPRLSTGAKGSGFHFPLYPTQSAADAIHSAEAKVVGHSGAVHIPVTADPRVRSIACAYNVGPEDSVEAPDPAAAELRNGAGVTGVFVQPISGSDTFVLPAGTVPDGQAVAGVVIGYLAVGGVGEAGHRDDHGEPLTFGPAAREKPLVKWTAPDHSDSDPETGIISAVLSDPGGYITEVVGFTKTGEGPWGAEEPISVAPVSGQRYYHEVTKQRNHQSSGNLLARGTGPGGEPIEVPLIVGGFDSGLEPNAKFFHFFDEDAATMTGVFLCDPDCFGGGVKFIARKNAAILEAEVDAVATTSPAAGLHLVPTDLGTMESGLQPGDLVNVAWKGAAEDGTLQAEMGYVTIPFSTIQAMLYLDSVDEDRSAGTVTLGWITKDDGGQADDLYLRGREGAAGFPVTWGAAVASPPLAGVAYLQELDLLASQWGSQGEALLEQTHRGRLREQTLASPIFHVGDQPRVYGARLILDRESGELTAQGSVFFGTAYVKLLVTTNGVAPTLANCRLEDPVDIPSTSAQFTPADLLADLGSAVLATATPGQLAQLLVLPFDVDDNEGPPFRDEQVFEAPAQLDVDVSQNTTNYSITATLTRDGVGIGHIEYKDKGDVGWSSDFDADAADESTESATRARPAAGAEPTWIEFRGVENGEVVAGVERVDIPSQLAQQPVSLQGFSAVIDDDGTDVTFDWEWQPGPGVVDSEHKLEAVLREDDGTVITTQTEGSPASTTTDSYTDTGAGDGIANRYMVEARLKDDVSGGVLDMRTVEVWSSGSI